MCITYVHGYVFVVYLVQCCLKEIQLGMNYIKVHFYPQESKNYLENHAEVIV